MVTPLTMKGDALGSRANVVVLGSASAARTPALLCAMVTPVGSGASGGGGVSGGSAGGTDGGGDGTGGGDGALTQLQTHARSSLHSDGQVGVCCGRGERITGKVRWEGRGGSRGLRGRTGL